MYHNIATAPASAQSRGLYVTPSSFARQMRLLRLFGFQGLSVSEALPYLRGKKRGRVAVITFDDGYADNLESALPVLQKHGFSATCYVVSQHVGMHNIWDAERLGVKKPLMSVSQLRTWYRAGMEVGAHTRTHPHLTQCTNAQLEDEIAGCKIDLEMRLGAPVTQFCYPYGDYDERVVDAVRSAGYVAATTTRRGRCTTDSDLLLLPRVHVVGRTMPHLFVAKLLTHYEMRRV